MFRPIDSLPASIAAVPSVASALIVALALAFAPVRADTPASQVITQSVGAGQDYHWVPAHGEGWFDSGGFCKVVDVGDLSWTSPPSDGVPVFHLGDAAQWENWRQTVPSRYNGQVASTTCCRPQSNIATLCAGASNPTPISRQYGKLGETDIVSATCLGPYGQYTESVPLTCSGDNGPDGQAAWQAGADSDQCTPDASVSYGGCSAGCGGGNLYETVYNSCGQVTAQGYFGPGCNTQSCCTPSSVSCGACGPSNTQTCSDGCSSWTQGCVCQPTYNSCGACDGGGNKTCTDTTCGRGSQVQACQKVLTSWGMCAGGGPSCNPVTHYCGCQGWVTYGPWSGDAGCFSDYCDGPPCDPVYKNNCCYGPIDYFCYSWE
jgi:hypothetical protein